MEFSSHVRCYNTSSFQGCELLVKQIWELCSRSPRCETTLLYIYYGMYLFKTSVHLSQKLKDGSGQTHLVLEPVSSLKFCWLPHKLPSFVHVSPSMLLPPHFCRGVNNSAGATHKKRFLLVLWCRSQQERGLWTTERLWLRYCLLLLACPHLQSSNIESEFSSGLSESHKVVAYILNRNFTEGTIAAPWPCCQCVNKAAQVPFDERNNVCPPVLTLNLVYCSNEWICWRWCHPGGWGPTKHFIPGRNQKLPLIPLPANQHQCYSTPAVRVETLCPSWKWTMLATAYATCAGPSSRNRKGLEPRLMGRQGKTLDHQGPFPDGTFGQFQSNMYWFDLVIDIGEGTAASVF